MLRCCNRTLLLPFIWLQCLAPLLHAHAGGELETGMHLAESLSTVSSGVDAPTLGNSARGAVPAVIGVATSLEPRSDTLFLSQPGLAAAMPGSVARQTPRWSATPWLDPPHPQGNRELPLPGAPPMG